jgi:hypothetical protein
MRRFGLLPAFLLLLAPAAAGAQTFDGLGTRAAGMGGAFVAVTDDASAVYWNPGALAQGAFFSMALDVTSGKAEPEGGPGADEGSRSSGLIALTTPALGISYYRLRSSIRQTPPGGGSARLANLVTHHTGVTLVQSLGGHVSTGTTLKLVRGAAASALASEVDTDDPRDIVGRDSTHFDLDAGVLATFGALRAGVTARNLTAPEFDTLTEGDPLRLNRQVRAGISYMTAPGVLLALDADLTRNRGSLGDERSVAVGAEARLGRRLSARTGVHLNTLDTPAGRAPAVGFGGSYAATASLLVDASVTTGSDQADRGWGVAARLVF